MGIFYDVTEIGDVTEDNNQDLENPPPLDNGDPAVAQEGQHDDIASSGLHWVQALKLWLHEVFVAYDLESFFCIVSFMVLVTLLCGWFDKWVTEHRDSRCPYTFSGLPSPRSVGTTEEEGEERGILNNNDLGRDRRENKRSSPKVARVVWQRPVTASEEEFVDPQ